MEVAEFIARRTSSGEHRKRVLIEMARHTAWHRQQHRARTPEVMAVIERDCQRMVSQMRLRGYC